MILDGLAMAAGGALGALLRGWLMQRLHPRHLAAHPLTGGLGPEFATWVANLLGCGLLALWLCRGATGATGADTGIDAFVATGFCGGLTTFSTLCADAFRLRGDASAGAALRYVVASVLTGAALFNLILHFGT